MSTSQKALVFSKDLRELRIGGSSLTFADDGPGPRNHSTRDGSNTAQTISVFLSGFLLFPLVYSYIWAGRWAFGTTAPASEMASLEQQGLGSDRGSKDSNDDFMSSQNLYQILQRANAETKALHDLILMMINPEQHIRAFKDRILVDEHPIRLTSGKIVDPSKVALVHVLSKDGKLLAMLLGVDMKGHDGALSDPNLDWCHDEALRRWMDARAAEFNAQGRGAEAGVGLFCYTATSSATSLPGKAESWQEARLFPQDLPEGWPLKVFEGIPSTPSLEELRQMSPEEKRAFVEGFGH